MAHPGRFHLVIIIITNQKKTKYYEIMSSDAQTRKYFKDIIYPLWLEGSCWTLRERQADVMAAILKV